jgi:hypothetical protein
MGGSPTDLVAGAASPGHIRHEAARPAPVDRQDAPPRAAGRGVMRSWPLLVLAAPAAVAVWSGWVGLGQMTGFGIVYPLPGIWSSLRVDTAVTLPVGVEAYAAYALRALLIRSRRVSRRTRRFAGWSAAASLLLGMAGQVANHLLAQAGTVRAPWQITTAVSCLPVLVLGMGAALAHLLRADTCGEDREDPVPGPGHGSRTGHLFSVGGRLDEAEAAGRKLAAAGQKISRRALRRAGLHGSNADLGILAAMARERVTGGQVPAGSVIAGAQANGRG